jgi:hypothetical protein
MRKKTNKNMDNAYCSEYAIIKNSGLLLFDENDKKLLNRKKVYDSLEESEKNYFDECAKNNFIKDPPLENAVYIGIVPGGTNNGKTGDTADIVYYDCNKQLIDSRSIKVKNKVIKNYTLTFKETFMTDFVTNRCKEIGIKSITPEVYKEKLRNILPFMKQYNNIAIRNISQKEKNKNLLIALEVIRDLIQYDYVTYDALIHSFRTAKTIMFNKDKTSSIIEAINPIGDIRVGEIYFKDTLYHFNLYIGDNKYDITSKFPRGNLTGTIRITVCK